MTGSRITKAAIKENLYALGKTKFSRTTNKVMAEAPGEIVLGSPGCLQSMDALRSTDATHNATELKALVVLGKELSVDL